VEAGVGPQLEVYASHPPADRGRRHRGWVSSASDSVLLVRTPYGWRISGQPIGVFMAPGAVARQIPLPTEDRERLDSLTQVRATNAWRGA